VQAPFLLLVHPSVPAKSARELISLANARPGTVDFGSAGHGTSTGVALDLFRIMARAKITHVPYKGIGQALVDTLAGQVHGYFGNPLSSLVYVKAGRLRALAVTSAARSKVLPELPTVAESGVPGYESTTWHGWLMPAAPPRRSSTGCTPSSPKPRALRTWRTSSRGTARSRLAPRPSNLPATWSWRRIGGARW
jgi:tripartite-type tricarboxylate transporter receptor subunit TctC